MQDIAASSSSQGLPTPSDVTLEIGKVTVEVEIQAVTDDKTGWTMHSAWPSHLEKAITATLFAELKIGNVDDLPTSEISVVLSYDDEIQTLNRDYRGKDKATNVLSFPGLDSGELDVFLKQGVNSPALPLFMLGDLVLAYETIALEAEDQGKDIVAHFSHLIVHGLLHLLGHDHIENDEAEIMENTERQILASLNINDPYLFNELETNCG
jgi:probable rRNA maturation factor